MPPPPFDLCIFDLDGTLIALDESIWALLHRRLGSDPDARRAVLRDALAGRLSYPSWVAADVRLLQAAHVTTRALDALIAELHPAPGAHTLLHRLHAQGTKIAILSGGIDRVATRLLPMHLIASLTANALHFSPDGDLTNATPTPWDRDHKGAGVTSLIAHFGVTRARTAFIGNGDNDLTAAAAAGFSIAWRDAPPALIAASTCFEPGPDLMDLAPHLLTPTS